MIERITDIRRYIDFVRRMQGDERYSDPMLVTEEHIECNLIRSAAKPDNRALGVFSGGEMTGLFVFLVIPDEKYAEMLVGLSSDPAAYDEIFRYLQAELSGYKADFVFNPQNDLLKERLAARGARFEKEQQKMVFTHRFPQVDTSGVELLSPRYMDQYLAMHGTDAYWTGEKVAAATEKFRTFIAVEGETVVGYLDVTHCFGENEPYDLLVKEEYRRRGWGRKLLAAALTMNEPKDMMLLVDIDNEPAMRLYGSMGFIKAERQNNLTAQWKIEEVTDRAET